MFNVGDLVTRKSYNNDVVFEIVEINNDIYNLRGFFVRLSADSTIDDLCKDVSDEFRPCLDQYMELNRDEFFYLPGRILHFDGDEIFLKKCMDFYKKNHIKAYGFCMKENEFCNNVINYLDKYNSDILVLTGHDAFYRKKRNNNNYKNTDYYVSAIREARKYEKSHQKLLIVAGGCQSNYEDLIKAGANFASSPKRINIHALDPAIVAGSLSFSDKNKPIDLINILKKTKYGSEGMGGIITNGTMYIGFPRE